MSVVSSKTFLPSTLNQQSFFRVLLKELHIVSGEVTPLSITEDANPPAIVSFLLHCDQVSNIEAQVFILLGGESISRDSCFSRDTSIFLG